MFEGKKALFFLLLTKTEQSFLLGTQISSAESNITKHQRRANQSSRIQVIHTDSHAHTHKHTIEVMRKKQGGSFEDKASISP